MTEIYVGSLVRVRPSLHYDRIGVWPTTYRYTEQKFRLMGKHEVAMVVAVHGSYLVSVTSDGVVGDLDATCVEIV